MSFGANGDFTVSAFAGSDLVEEAVGSGFAPQAAARASVATIPRRMGRGCRSGAPMAKPGRAPSADRALFAQTGVEPERAERHRRRDHRDEEIGRASCRER